MRAPVRHLSFSIALVLLAWAVPVYAQPTIEIVPASASCTNCNSGLVTGSLAAPDGGGPLCNCGDGGQCVPGRTKDCYPCEGKTFVGRFLCGLYECICCPDPCYEPKWTPLADTAFFVEAARPVTQTKLRYDSLQSIILPDRSEYFWARADGKGKGPSPVKPLLGERSLRSNDFILVNEGGNGLISLVTETPYRNIQPDFAGHASGFSDMSIATKTLLFDCELIQISLMMKTYLPVGNARKGLGVGHVSLEPSLLMGIKITPTTYFQGQLSEWIPLGGDPAHQGSILHVHTSLNQELCRVLPDVPIIGTLELNCWDFQDGLYTDPILGAQKSSGYKYVTMGSGVRMFVCDRLDIGFAAAFALSEQHLAEKTYRVEFRLRW